MQAWLPQEHDGRLKLEGPVGMTPAPSRQIGSTRYLKCIEASAWTSELVCVPSELRVRRALPPFPTRREPAIFPPIVRLDRDHARIAIQIAVGVSGVLLGNDRIQPAQHCAGMAIFTHDDEVLQNTVGGRQYSGPQLADSHPCAVGKLEVFGTPARVGRIGARLFPWFTTDSCKPRKQEA